MAELKSYFKVAFYKTNGGNEPVRDWLKRQNKEDKKILGEDIRTVQLRWPLGMPLVRAMGNGLHEIRSNVSGKKIARVFFTIKDGCIILLHGFMKKTQQTPQREIDIARERMK